jgi:hypothetical protein
LCVGTAATIFGMGLFCGLAERDLIDDQTATLCGGTVVGAPPASSCDSDTLLGYTLCQGALQTLCGLPQLALKSLDLLRYILELFFGKHSCLRNLMSRAIRSAHCGPDFHRNLPESAPSGHVIPPVETGAILYC